MYVFVVWVVFIWSTILFFDLFLKSCMVHPYFRALKSLGLNIKPFIIQCKMTCFNSAMNRMGQHRPFLKFWFNIGAIVTCIITIPCLLLYVVALYQAIFSSSAEDYKKSVIQPLIPGVNFPSYLWLTYIMVILICSVVHEFGHALAASRERIGIDDMGFAVCVVCPVAFVHLRFEQFRMISIWQQMRIVCAGIWHNIVLAIFAFLASLLIMTSTSSLFITGNGVSVVQVHQESLLGEPHGFSINDHILKVDRCLVNDRVTWSKCLNDVRGKAQGFCIPNSLPYEAYEYVPEKKCENGLFFSNGESNLAKESPGLCLSGRAVIQNLSMCFSEAMCEKDSLCLYPKMPKNHHFFRIIRFGKPTVFYTGPVDELLADVIVSDLVQRHWFYSPGLASSIQDFFEYLIMFSSGLACLNVLPICGFDGQYIIRNIIHLFGPYFLPSHSQRECVFLWIRRLICAIAACLAVISARKMYLYYF